MYKNCTGVIETNIERVCFDVNELVCDLVEAIHYETFEETYQVQRCFTGKDRVCDTTYKIDMTTKDDYQCTNVETPNCYMDLKALCAIENPPRAAITSPGRSKWRSARLTCTGTVRSFPTSSPSQLRSRTATSSPRRSASLR